MKTHDQLFKDLTKGSPVRRAQVHLETIKTKIIENLVELREDVLKLTQTELASKLGMAQQVVSRIENGENITLDTLIRYIDGLHHVIKVEHTKVGRKNNILRFITEIEDEIAYSGKY